MDGPGDQSERGQLPELKLAPPVRFGVETSRVGPKAAPTVITGLLANDPVPVRASVPSPMVVLPEYVLAPERVNLPAPTFAARADTTNYARVCRRRCVVAANGKQGGAAEFDRAMPESDPRPVLMSFNRLPAVRSRVVPAAWTKVDVAGIALLAVK